MSIDLGNAPVGTPPTPTEQTQLRTSFGLGAADTVEFGGFVPPSGTTAEIDAVTNAVVGQVMIDTDRNRQVRFVGAASYVVVGYPSSDVYYVDPQNGDDSTGAVGALAFATINAALAAAVADATPNVVVQCLAGVYSEVDAFNGVTLALPTSIVFDSGAIYSNGAMAGVFFDNTSGLMSQLQLIGGSLVVTNSNHGFFKGSAIANPKTTLLELDGVQASVTASSLIEITGGKATVKVGGVLNYAFSTLPLLVVSGGAIVGVHDIQASYAQPFTTPVLPAITLSGNDSILKLVNVSIENAGLCEILDDTTCKLILYSCNCSEGTFPGDPLTVKAPASSTSPKAFALGSTAVPKAATNITVDTTFGSFVADVKAEDLF